ncbi:MAG: glycosyltransferase family 4 protein [Vicinamibacteria bacterium]
MTIVRVIAFVPYPLGTAPSQRFRLEQWNPRLRELGIEMEFRPFASPALVKTLYRPGMALRKALKLSQALITQFRNLPAQGSFDLAVVHRSMSLAGPAFLERRLSRSLPFVYDFDDAIHLVNTSEANRAFGWLKFPDKVAEICGLAKAMTVGNEYLAAFARQHGSDVTIVPSSVDTTLYRPRTEEKAGPRNVVGWMGSSTSQALMEPYAPLLERIAASGLVVRMVSDRRPTFSFPFEWRPWSAETEVAELRDFDVGIMPLPDTEWAKGKCAMKILQYMGVGTPSVGSALGGNLEVVTDGQNGFLATSQDEWVMKIHSLIGDRALARRIGAAGRDTVLARYSTLICADRMASVIRRVARTENAIR